MDALGKLTGGLAHDYNNMLGIILGYTELLDMTVPDSPTTRDYVSKIKEASQRGVALTKKMLSLSRQQPTQAAKVDLNEMLKEQQQMLQKTLTARINVKIELAQSLWDIWVDDGDLLDAIVNLSINAMHATSTTGTLTFVTLNKRFSEKDFLPVGVSAGDYVLLRVQDTGVGMEKEVLARVFDPFYTTKSDGSGLGLSQVYGFMGRSEGAVQVESVIGEGTCFTLYFPRCIKQMENHKDELAVDDLQMLEGTESILVVDDELELLEVASELFSGYGYQVHTAISAAVALKILDERKIDFVLSDVVMPEADGYELAAIIQYKYPQLPVQLVSGYNERVSTLHFDKTLKENLISKPYSTRIVLARIREILDAKTV